MFNADLALSVTMTGISTIISTVMLPVNLFIYASITYSSEVVKSLNWASLFLSLVVVIGGIAAGIGCSAWYNSTRFNLLANKMGNLAGITLVLFSALVSSTNTEASLWTQDAKFYIGVAMPAVIGVIIATYMATKFQLDKPERVSVAVEGCYQNTGIATSVAITMFSGTELATAIGGKQRKQAASLIRIPLFCFDARIFCAFSFIFHFLHFLCFFQFLSIMVLPRL